MTSAGSRWPRGSAGPAAPTPATSPSWSPTGPRPTTGGRTRTASSTSLGARGRRRAARDPAAPADAPTVVLLHGWPDSFLRFERVLPLLDRPQRRRALPARLPVADPPTDARHVDGRHGRAGRRRDGRARDTSATSSPAATSAARSREHLAAPTPTGWPRSTSPTSPTRTCSPSTRRAHPGGASYLDDGRALAVRRGRLRPRAGDQAAHPRGALGDSPAGLPPGSWRSSAPGATAAATSSRSSPATTC